MSVSLCSTPYDVWTHTDVCIYLVDIMHPIWLEGWWCHPHLYLQNPCWYNNFGAIHNWNNHILSTSSTYGLSQNAFLILNDIIKAISYMNPYDVVPIGFHIEEHGFLTINHNAIPLTTTPTSMMWWNAQQNATKYSQSQYLNNISCMLVDMYTKSNDRATMTVSSIINSFPRLP